MAHTTPEIKTGDTVRLDGERAEITGHADNGDWVAGWTESGSQFTVYPRCYDGEIELIEDEEDA